MAEIDPITREALMRADRMQGHARRNNPPPEPPGENHRHHHSPPKPPLEHTPEPLPKPPAHNALEALFKDKETSVILILIVLLMGEKNCEHLLLALIYLLI